VTDRADLLAAILANPDDDNVRLVYADWLQEHGDDARAEFIRVQIELAKLPPKPRELFVADGAGKRMEGLGVALTPRGDGHYSVSDAERGLSIESFVPDERVDVYAHLARGDRIGWLRGLRYVKHVENRNEIIFRKDSGSGPWIGATLANRERELLIGSPAGPWGANAWFSDWLSSLGHQWPGGDGDPSWEFRRGFVEALTCSAADWLAHADAILAEHPVRRVRLTTRPEFGSTSSVRTRDRPHNTRTVWATIAGRRVNTEPIFEGEAFELYLLEARWPGVEFELPPYEVRSFVPTFSVDVMPDGTLAPR
jgi:uncharacterized protein (TIGR02996 family)